MGCAKLARSNFMLFSKWLIGWLNAKHRNGDKGNDGLC